MTRVSGYSQFLSDLPEPFASTRGAPLEMLALHADEGRSESWEALLEELLRWRHEGKRLFLPEDEPAPEVLDTALDFIQDFRANKLPPTSVTPSGSGNICFEWRAGGAGNAVVESLEFTGQGKAQYVRIDQGRVTEMEQWYRLPSRRTQQ